MSKTKTKSTRETSTRDKTIGQLAEEIGLLRRLLYKQQEQYNLMLRRLEMEEELDWQLQDTHT